MSRRVLVLVEGYTEERFVKDVLAPYFDPKDCYLSPTLLVTKRVKDGVNFKGGVTNFAKFKNDLKRLLNDAGGALVTTIIDYYRLPTDFPGMNDRPRNGTPWQRVEHVESKIQEHFGNPRNLSVFLALHEFEAWLFSSSIELPRAMTEPKKQSAFAAIRNEYKTPEEINERPGYGPSDRIIALFPAYKKA
ncbi:MAG: DUF4276 family protein [Candidatus Sumerlaeota bacterium]|nr:DUF4276 family protein [Candidatus Sumerlaeota bacterium]